MTPLSHFREAERLLERAMDCYGDTLERSAVEIAAAHAHALLAQVSLAANAVYSMDDRDEWEMALKGQVPS